MALTLPENFANVRDSALRGLTVTLQDQDAQRLAPAMKRAAKLFTERLKDPRRIRDALDRLGGPFLAATLRWRRRCRSAA